MSRTGHIDQKFIAILIALYNSVSIESAKKIDPVIEFAKLGLNENLSSQRSNGLRSMIELIKKFVNEN